MPFISLTIESALTEGLPIDVASVVSLLVSIIGVTLFYYSSIEFNLLGFTYCLLNVFCTVTEQVRRATPVLLCHTHTHTKPPPPPPSTSTACLSHTHQTTTTATTTTATTLRVYNVNIRLLPPPPLARVPSN